MTWNVRPLIPMQGGEIELHWYDVFSVADRSAGRLPSVLQTSSVYFSYWQGDWFIHYWWKVWKQVPETDRSSSLLASWSKTLWLEWSWGFAIDFTHCTVHKQCHFDLRSRKLNMLRQQGFAVSAWPSSKQCSLDDRCTMIIARRRMQMQLNY